ncbi:hypothetical protein ACNJ7E_16145 [Rhodococcus sp. NM-2]|uniref:hypothetical protein n=1 Tax=Rhodococcus sp. NM-2 TaxID=3401174 RepID=UPI003AAF5BDF
MRFRFSYRGQPISIGLTQDRARLRLHPCSAGPVRLCVEGIEKTLPPGEVWEEDLPSAAAADALPEPGADPTAPMFAR